MKKKIHTGLVKIHQCLTVTFDMIHPPLRKNTFLNEQEDLALQTLLTSNRSIFYSMKEEGRSSKSHVKEYTGPSALV